MRDVLIGQTDYSVLVKIIGTDGAPETGLAHTAIDIAYARVETDNDVTTSDVAPASLAALTDAHSDWGWLEVSSTDHPGLYRLDIADAVFASGAWEAVVTITDASGTDFYAVDIGFRLISRNEQTDISQTGDGYAIVNSGTHGNAALKTLIDTVDDFLDTEVAAILAAVDTEVAAIKTKTDNLPSDPADASDIAAAFATVNSTLSTIAGYIDTEVAAILAAVDTEIASIITSLATIAGYLDTEVAAILAAVDTEVAAIKAKTDSLTFTDAGKVDCTIQAAADLKAAVANRIADHVRRRTQANVEASSDGDAVSVGSEYGFIQQAQESSVSGSTLTIKKTDGTTTLGTKTVTTNASADPITGVS